MDEAESVKGLPLFLQHALCVVDGLHRVLSIEVCSDHIRVLLIQNCASYHDFAVRLFFPQKTDRLFHTDDSGCHKGA